MVLPDPDPYDWFCDDDVKVVCALNRKEITVGCRPHHIREECKAPKWCPIRVESEEDLHTREK